MRGFIDSQIIAKRAQLQELDRQKLTVEAELRVYEEMLGHLDEPKQQVKANGAHPLKTDKPSGIPSEMTPGWRKILCGIEKLGRTFGAADIVSVGNAVGEPTKMVNARSQIYQWEKKHIIGRVRKGRYRLAQRGTEMLRKGEGPELETSEPS